MNSLIIILQTLAALGINLAQFEIQTVKPSDTVYDCNAYAELDATILVCEKQRLILIVKG